VSEIHCGFAKNCLQRNDLRILGCTGIGLADERIEKLPPWVPDWHHDVSGVFLSNDKLFHAFPSASAAVTIKDNDIIILDSIHAG
jgi:hypothetical protein